MSLEQPNVSKSKKDKPKENGIEIIFNIKTQMSNNCKTSRFPFKKTLPWSWTLNKHCFEVDLT